MKNITDSVLEQIKKENIKPIPKWQFLLKDSVIWTTFVLSLMIGSIGTSISIFLAVNSDVLNTSFNDLSFVQGIVFAVPFFWIILSVFFIFLAYYNIKHTEGGFRWNVLVILVINILLSLLMGLILYFTGVSAKLNQIFIDNIPYYSQFADVRDQVWMRPESGYLAGEIISIGQTDNTLILIDLNGKEWNIDLANADIRHSIQLEAGIKIKLSGKKIGDSFFSATEVRPWMGMMQGGMMQGGQVNGIHKLQENSSD